MKRDLQTICTVAREAGRRIREGSQQQYQPDTKEGIGDYVTQLDQEIDQYVISEISKHYPEDQFLTEETYSDIEAAKQAEHLWIVDPIDGTSNFVFHRNFSAVSIGYAYQGKLTLGVIYDPFHDELYTAELSKGAFLNNHPIHITNHSFQNRWNIGTDNSYQPEIIQRHLRMLLSLDPVPMVHIRGAAAITIAWAAAGKLDAYFTTKIQPWDKAAGILIAQEAGATVTSFNPDQPVLFAPGILVGKPAIIDHISSQLHP